MFNSTNLRDAFILAMAAFLVAGCGRTGDDATDESEGLTKRKIGNGREVTDIAQAREAEQAVITPKQDDRMRPGARLTIAGTVRDKAGVPVDDAEVEVLPARNWRPHSNGGGRFEVEWWPPRSTKQMGKHHLVVRHTQRNLAAVVEINEDTNALDVTLEPSATLTGRVVDAAGNGIAEALITMKIKGPDWLAAHPGFIVHADAEGRFGIRALPLRHKYVLTARMSKWRGYRASHIEVEPDDVPGTRIDTGPIVLAKGEFSISGIVVGSNDQPVADLGVYCTGEDQPGSRTATDTDGKFTVDGVFRGKVTLTAGGYRLYGYTDTEAGATNVKIVLDNKGVAPPKGRACFPIKTGVWVDGVVVPISNIARGWAVGKLTRAVPGTPFGQIERIEEHEGAFECRDIVLDSGNRISVVDAHCFMLDSGRWIAAQDLRDGMKLKTLHGSVGIKSVATRATPYIGKVYNLKIANSDRYMVGEDGVIVRDY